jgi:hypothetical protein
VNDAVEVFDVVVVARDAAMRRVVSYSVSDKTSVIHNVAKGFAVTPQLNPSHVARILSRARTVG